MTAKKKSEAKIYVQIETACMPGCTYSMYEYMYLYIAGQPCKLNKGHKVNGGVIAQYIMQGLCGQAPLVLSVPKCLNKLHQSLW